MDEAVSRCSGSVPSRCSPGRVDAATRLAVPGVAVHEVHAHEASDFELVDADAGWTDHELPCTVSGLRFLAVGEQVVVVRLYDADPGWWPFREHDQVVLRLGAEKWGRTVRNGRSADARGDWTYHKIVANVANVDQPARDLFTSVGPDHLRDEQRPLR